MDDRPIRAVFGCDSSVEVLLKMNVRGAPFVLFLAVMLVACPRNDKYDPALHPPSSIEKDDLDEDAEEAEELDETEATADKRVVARLLEPGEEPREKLRYGVRSGLEGSIDMRLSMTMKRPQPLEIPEIVIRMHLSKVQADSEGFSYVVEFDEPKVADSDDIPADHLDDLRRDLAGIAALRGVVSLDDRGSIRDVSFSDVVDGLQLEQLVTEIEQAVRTMTMPLPEEPVGIGAVWELVQPFSSNELDFEQRTRMTLKEKDGDKLTIETSVVQSAGRQEVPSPQLPPDARMYVNRLKGESAGVSFIDLSSLLPHDVTTTSSSTEMDMEVHFDGERQAMDMAMEIEVELGAVRETE